MVVFLFENKKPHEQIVRKKIVTIIFVVTRNVHRVLMQAQAMRH